MIPDYVQGKVLADIAVTCHTTSRKKTQIRSLYLNTHHHCIKKSIKCYQTW